MSLKAYEEGSTLSFKVYVGESINDLRHTSFITMVEAKYFKKRKFIYTFLLYLFCKLAYFCLLIYSLPSNEMPQEAKTNVLKDLKGLF